MGGRAGVDVDYVVDRSWLGVRKRVCLSLCVWGGGGYWFGRGQSLSL